MTTCEMSLTVPSKYNISNVITGQSIDQLCMISIQYEVHSTKTTQNKKCIHMSLCCAVLSQCCFWVACCVCTGTPVLGPTSQERVEVSNNEQDLHSWLHSLGWSGYAGQQTTQLPALKEPSMVAAVLVLTHYSVLAYRQY